MAAEKAGGRHKFEKFRANSKCLSGRGIRFEPAKLGWLHGRVAYRKRQAEAEMIGYYKEHIYTLSEAVSAIQSSQDCVDQLKSIQLYLIRRILNSEKKIGELEHARSRLRRELRSHRPAKEKAKKIKKKIKFYQDRIKQHKWMLFVWRCFGDAIVFLYLDKFAIKPFLYDFGSSTEKQTAGRLAGKEGLKAELSVAFDALESGVPAILCDLTNCIRHGDICLLGENDPVVIEVKSSTNTNLRIDRQLEAISGLHEYLSTDQSNKLYGVHNLKRMELGVSEVNYRSTVHQLISQSRKNGFHHCSPEMGLHIFALWGANVGELGGILSGLDRPIAYFLNETKNAEAWGSYYPFTLSIDKPDELYAFLKGDVFLIVVIEIGVCQVLAKRKGWTLEFREFGDYAFAFIEDEEDKADPFRFNLSHHFVGRIAHEFVSLQWVMDFQEHNIQLMKSLVSESGNA